MREITEEEFAPLPHRRVPASFRGRWYTRFYRVSLARGAGTGIRIRSPRSAPGERLPLAVLLHGLGDDCTYPLWPWFDAIVERGFEVFSLDWDGHGAAGDSLLDYSRVGESLRGVLSRVREQWNPASMSLIGHSTGALVATVHRELEILNAEPPRIAKYLLVSPALALRTEREWKNELKAALSPEFWLRAAPAALQVFGFPGALPAVGWFKRREFPVRVADPALGSAVAQLQRALRLYQPELPAGHEALRQGTPDCHAYFGSLDSIVHEPRALTLLEKVFGSVEVTRFEGKGHLLTAISPSTARRIAEDLAR